MAQPPRVTEPFDPLAVESIGVTLALELLEQPLHLLPPAERFVGAGVYALYYGGDLEAYAPLREMDAQEGGWRLPVYIGKAVRENSKQGFRVPPTAKTKLYDRIRAHARSINQTDNLSSDDFRCRYLVLDDAYISLAESVLITTLRPPWNGMGLGSNVTGGPRMKGKGSLWDSLHPGRKGRPEGTPETAAKAAEQIARSLAQLANPPEDPMTARMIEKIRRRAKAGLDGPEEAEA